MTSSKAVAAGIAAQFVTIANWLLTLIPHWASVPEPVQSALHGLVSAGIAAVVVYYAPANRLVSDPTPAPGLIGRLESQPGS